MGYFRFRRSIKILPGVRWNIGKNSTSVSIGGRGLTYTVGTKGSRTTVGIPGTGISYTQVHTPKPASTIPPPPPPPPASTTPAPPPPPASITPPPPAPAPPPSSSSPQNPPKRRPSKIFYTLGCVMLAIWLLNKVLDQSTPRSPASNALPTGGATAGPTYTPTVRKALPVEPAPPSSNALSADAATIKEWADRAEKRAEEWRKQQDLRANAAPPSPYGAPSAGPTYTPTVRKALPVEPTAAPSGSPSTTPLVATYRVVNDLPKGILNLREGPGSAYRTLVLIKAGTGGIRIGEGRYNGPTLWRKIWVGPHTGWVNQDYLEAENPTP
jgi:uncharacterized protein DUF4236